MNPQLSFVIVNWNGGDLLKRCVESIAKFPPPVTHEVDWAARTHDRRREPRDDHGGEQGRHGAHGAAADRPRDDVAQAQPDDRGTGHQHCPEQQPVVHADMVRLTGVSKGDKIL